ncbi:MAG: hypothetical protein RR587_09795 [Solibacillus sp.]
MKQIAGTLFYKPAQHEFYRIQDDGIHENFPNPFDQAYQHQLFLENLFASWKLAIPYFIRLLLLTTVKNQTILFKIPRFSTLVGSQAF